MAAIGNDCPYFFLKCVCMCPKDMSNIALTCKKTLSPPFIRNSSSGADGGGGGNGCDGGGGGGGGFGGCG